MGTPIDPVSDSSSKPLDSYSKAIVPYRPPISETFKSDMERSVDEIYKHSMEVAKFETAHLHHEGFEPELESHIVIPEYLQLSPDALQQARPRRLYHVLPPLGGPYPVGYSSLVLDSSKMAGADRRVGVEIYAPTRNPVGNKLLMRLNPGHCLETVMSTSQLQALQTNAVDQLEPIKPMPLIIFSHGCGCNPHEYRPLLEELASHGFAVLCLNHPSSSSDAPFSEDKIGEFRDGDPSYNKSLIGEMASKQAANTRFVLDQIRHGPFGDIVKDLGLTDQMVLVGHSLGGASSVMVARDDPSISGCINLDGALMGDDTVRAAGVKTPVMALYSEHILRKEGTEGYEEEQQIHKEWEAFHAACEDCYQEIIKGADHMDFTVFPLLGWMIGMESVGGATLEGAQKTFAVTSERIIKFMNSLDS